MAPYIVCVECGEKGLKEYSMVLRHGPNGFRRYAVCAKCTGGVKKSKGGRQRMLAKAKAQKAGM